MLVQTPDDHKLTTKDFKVVSLNENRPKKKSDALLFAWIVCKHTKSNAIVYARTDQTVGRRRRADVAR